MVNALATTTGLDPRLVLDLLGQLGATARGAVARVPHPPLDPAGLAELDAWCTRRGHLLHDAADGVVRIVRGPVPDPYADLPPGQRPSTRLWLYTNFDCNLACDYCCVSSSPRAPRAALTLPQIEELAQQAAAAGLAELVLTGGEPFLRPDLDRVTAACTARLPTTLLTNGMLLTGTRLARLRSMDRDRLTLQVSLDSAEAARHDAHRGAGSWERALHGIATARREGFRVKVAATVHGGHAAATLGAFLTGFGVPAEHQVVRAVSRQGVADHGVSLSPQTLIPELTVTAAGTYWHPVAAADPEFRITEAVLPLTAALIEMHRRFTRYRAVNASVAHWFPCA